MKKKAAKKKTKMSPVMTRRGVLLIALLAVLILVINLITASYSWFTPQPDTKKGLKYEFVEGKIRSESCSMSNYTGVKVTDGDRQQGEYVDQIRYSTPASNSISLSAGQTMYIKTEILNSDTNNASDISLYLSSINGSFTLAVTYPSNTVRKYSSNQTDLYIVRDAYVKRRDNADVNGPGKLEIEWFVTANTATSFNLGNLYILYN